MALPLQHFILSATTQGLQSLLWKAVQTYLEVLLRRSGPVQTVSFYSSWSSFFRRKYFRMIFLTPSMLYLSLSFKILRWSSMTPQISSSENNCNKATGKWLLKKSLARGRKYYKLLVQRPKTSKKRKTKRPDSTVTDLYFSLLRTSLNFRHSFDSPDTPLSC